LLWHSIGASHRQLLLLLLLLLQPPRDSFNSTDCRLHAATINFLEYELAVIVTFRVN